MVWCHAKKKEVSHLNFPHRYWHISIQDIVANLSEHTKWWLLLSFPIVSLSGWMLSSLGVLWKIRWNLQWNALLSGIPRVGFQTENLNLQYFLFLITLFISRIRSNILIHSVEVSITNKGKESVCLKSREVCTLRYTAATRKNFWEE